MLLPTELILQVLHYADYKTLVLAKIAGARFLRLTVKFAEELARRHNFMVSFKTTYIEYIDMTIRESQSFPYDHGNQTSLAAACREVAVAVGSHAVLSVTFNDNTWSMPGVGVIFEAPPSLKYAHDVTLFSARGLDNEGDSDTFTSNFVGMKWLRLDDDAFRQFSRSFLQPECARELEGISVLDLRLTPTRIMNCSVEEFVRNCATLPHLLVRQALILDFSMHRFSGSFGLKIIELLKNSGRELTFRMKVLQDGDKLVLDESEYTVDVDGNTTRYASKSSGIVVEIDGRFTTIRSTARLSRKK
ncbi:hypothetical protein AAVH_25082 [Aphelenchoides avenae]|nr:hypothetical protein AAVH_25082 [Aphelenchus avenae]